MTPRGSYRQKFSAKRRVCTTDPSSVLLETEFDIRMPVLACPAMETLNGQVWLSGSGLSRVRT